MFVNLVPSLKMLTAPARMIRGVLRSTSATLEEFLHPPRADEEFERDIRRLPVMGLAAGPNGVVPFDMLPRPLLRNQVKRFLRWRINTGKSYYQINRDSAALQRLADAFTSQAGPDQSAAQRRLELAYERDHAAERRNRKPSRPTRPCPRQPARRQSTGDRRRHKGPPTSRGIADVTG